MSGCKQPFECGVHLSFGCCGVGFVRWRLRYKFYVEYVSVLCGSTWCECGNYGSREQL